MKLKETVQLFEKLLIINSIMSLNWINITDVDWNEVIQIEEFTDIYDTKELSQSFFKDLKRSFFNKWKYKNILSQKQEFAWKNIYHYEDDIKMFEYDSMDKLQTDLKAWGEKFKKKNDLIAEEIDNRQVLEPSWYFEYEWKYYLLWLLYADQNINDTDEQKWVLNWVIVNHELYFWLNQDITNEVQEKSTEVWKIVDNK